MNAVCDLTADGNLRIPAAVAAQYFPHDVCVATQDGADLLLIPLRGPAHGGLLLKQRTRAGDRVLLVSEALGFAVNPGTYAACWEVDRGALRVIMGERQGSAIFASEGDPS